MSNLVKPIEIKSGSSFFKTEDFNGNSGLGRYVILCGSKQRAKSISEKFKNVDFREHPRGYDLFKGDFTTITGDVIQIAVVCTGIGAPSLDSLFHQLVWAGARRFIRIGTCGSLQPDLITTGSVVIAEGAVRDEATSGCYIHNTFPAIGTIEWIWCALQTSKKMSFCDYVYSGIVHTKDSLFAREFHLSLLENNNTYMEEIKRAGVVASDMETSLLYTLTRLSNFQSTKQYTQSENSIKALSILAVVGDKEPFSKDSDAIKMAEDRAVELGLMTIQTIYNQELEGIEV